MKGLLVRLLKMFKKKAPVIGLGFPLSSNPMCWNDFAFSVMDMITYSLKKGIVSEFKSYRITSSDIALNRNKLFGMAKKDNVDVHFQLDNDMVVPEDCIERLLDLQRVMPDCLLTGHSAVGGPPHYMSAWMEDSNGEGAILWDPPDRPFECHFCGGFALWIPSSILQSKKLQEKPFTIKEQDPAEDFSFCRNVREAGFKIIVDPSLEFGHLRPQKVGKSHWEMQRKGLDESKYVHLSS